MIFGIVDSRAAIVMRAIEAALAPTTGVTIESPKRLRDKHTGKLREHDVILTYTADHHSLNVAIECRDRSRPITVEAVEAFHNKCQATGIHSGVMVSSKGFWETAIKKAAAYNIRCLTLDQVERFDWSRSTTLHILHRNLSAADMRVLFSKRD